MRLRYTAFFLLLTCCATALRAQTTLFAENFDNGCILPAGWQVKLTGNQNPVWYVDNALHNDEQVGTSMNGSCFLVIDDDETGDGTQPYVCDFISPPFDASQHPNVSFSVDVHYRDYGDSQESFHILVTDGVTETLLRTFTQGQSTGDSLHEFISVKFDLSFITSSPNTRVIFRYDDGAGYAWWAAIDNILVVGSGEGENVVKETFNGCTKPAGWETQVVTGVDDWQFGYVTNPKTTWAGTSMDGTCLAYFDDDLLGADAPFSNVRLLSPWFDGAEYGRFELSFDIIMRYYREKVAVYVEHADGSEYLVQEAAYDVGGPHFPDYIHAALDISPYRAQQMRVIFEYDDGQDYSWWIGLDNVKITGSGVANDICVNAKPLFTGANCQASSNQTALFDGPVPACISKPVAGLWYSWTADFTGLAKLSSGANFNDVVNVFTGDCTNPQALVCNDRDEHGFVGEGTYFPAQSGTTYYIRVCGKEGGFGVSRGNLCVKLEQVNTPPAVPANDNCANALPLQLDAPCLAGSNVNATSSTEIPSLNELARADVWYKFTAAPLASGEVLELLSNADFSDILTVYSGTCANLNEVAGNHKGGSLKLDNLTAGQSYLLQIAGNFATIEGALCVQMQKKLENAPANDNCSSATEVAIGSACTAGSNIGASFSGNTPPCVAKISRDVWFKFTAPASGSVRVNSGADFQHVLALWKGSCNDLVNVGCVENPLRCDGFMTVGGLSAGQTYYLQVATQELSENPASGNVCIKITDGNLPADFTPINLVIEERCVDVDMAKLVFNLSGGLAPFTFSGNSENEILPAGSTYFVVISDALGCEKSISGIVDECEAVACSITASPLITAVQCHGEANGAVSVSISGGVTPYQYAWSNGATAAEITSLAAGIYTVTVTDAVNCEEVITAVVSEPAELIISVVSVTNPSQGQNNGYVDINVSGFGLLNPVWTKNGTVFSTGVEDLINAGAGDYVLTVTDPNGCSVTLAITLTETVGTKDLAGASFTEVFPNPAKDKAVLAVAFPQARTLYLTLSDASGRALHTWTENKVTEQNIPLDLKNLPAGTYQLRIVTGLETLTEKIVVVK